MGGTFKELFSRYAVREGHMTVKQYNRVNGFESSSNLNKSIIDTSLHKELIKDFESIKDFNSDWMDSLMDKYNTLSRTEILKIIVKHQYE